MTNYRENFQKLLRELFQFDSADLDFGIYAILNQRRDQIAQFIEERLPKILQEGLDVEAAEQRVAAQSKVDAVRKQVIELLGEDALDAQGNLTPAFATMANTPLVKSYLAIKAEVEANNLADDTEAQIYNDLIRFFSRYYDDGDFVTKRRFGQDKYALPYNGQEVYLHWANADQYYIKSGEHFTDYSFTLPATTSDQTARVVFFKLQQAEVDRDNTKSDDKRFFVLHPGQPFSWQEESRTLTLNFEYRTLTSVEKDRIGSRNQQDKLNEEALNTLTQTLPSPFLKAQLSQPDGDDEIQRPRFIRHLNRYTARNTHDFFIHKNLAPFLRQELDYFLKNEVLNIDDIDLSNPQQARLVLARVRAIRQIGHHVIAFLAQIENFQKKLFEKRKFVRQSDYCLTLDRIPESVRDEVYQAILHSPDQLQTWRNLYALVDTAPDLFNPNGNLTSIDENFLTLHPHLMMDTAFLPLPAKTKLLAAFDDLNEEIDGLLVQGDNLQALNLLLSRYEGQIESIYIDPPYNTDASPILYKNDYRSSSWISMMSDRLSVAKRFLDNLGILCVTIDDFQQKELHHLIEMIFGETNIAGTVAIRVNPSGRPTQTGFALAHEYAIFTRNNGDAVIRKMERTEAQKQRYSGLDMLGVFEWRNLRREGSNSDRERRKKLFYPIYATETSLRIPELKWKDGADEWVPQTLPENGEQVILPLDKNGVEKTWRWQHERVSSDLSLFTVKRNQDDELNVYYKYRPNPEGIVPPTIWYDSKYSATEHGTGWIKKLFGSNIFSYPKSVYAVEDCILLAGMREPDTICLDFFAGSGTTGHAVMNLNREDGGNRKYILVEMGDYFDTVLKPRLQKVAYAADWRDGQPVTSSKGQSHMFHYIRLENYEEVLTNIAFKDRQTQPDLFSTLEKMPDYQLHYMLDFETEESNSLLNLTQFNRPFEYRLKDGPVDLVTTFNFLLGLRVETQHEYTWDTGRVVCVIGTTPNEQRVGVIWRNMPTSEQMDTERVWLEQTVLAGLILDTLYINGDSVLPNAQPLEPEFKRLMFASVTPAPVLEVQ